MNILFALLCFLALSLTTNADPGLPQTVQLLPQGDFEISSLTLVSDNSRVEIKSGDTVPEGDWTISVEEGYWTPKQVLSAHASPTIPIWETYLLSGSVRVSEGELPGSLTLSFEQASSAATSFSVPKTSIECPIHEGFFSCEIPKAPLDIKIRARGFVSHFFWDVSKSQKLSLLLKPGSSLIGFAESTERNWRPEKATATLFPKTIAGDNSELMKRASLTEKLSPQGFFSFDVEAGTYTLEISHPGLATAVVTPLEVFPRSETQIRDTIVLEPEITLVLDVAPALDWEGKDWQITLQKASTITGGFDDRPAFKGRLAEGRIELPNRMPGLYDLEITDSRGNRFYSDSDLEVKGSGKVEVYVQLEIFPIQGTLLHGDNPLSNTSLYFGGKYGAISIRTESDEDGAFEVLLPRLGKWHLEIQREDWLAKKQIIIEREETDIRIPNTEVFGLVVDAAGKVISGAGISLRTTEGSTSNVRSDDDGFFKIVGIEPGWGSVAARTHSHYSAQQTVQVSEDNPLGPLRLIVDGSTKEVTGRVSGGRGPVAGALLRMSASTPPAYASSARTDLHGLFKAMIAGHSSTLDVMILAPGYGLQGHTTVVDNDSIELTLQEGKGTIVIEAPDDPPAGAIVRVFQGDRFLHPHLIDGWARSHGVQQTSEKMTLPDMRPGFYRACINLPEDVAGAVERGGNWQDALIECSEGYLQDGGTLVLEM